MTKQLRLVHLSDPHFASITFHPNQFLSKRWIGNLNLILFRNQFFHSTPLFRLPELFNKLHVDFVMMTGDFTTTSLDEEFSEAYDFVKLFKEPVFFLPGNHDCYTKEAEQKKLFYRYFPDQSGEWNLRLSQDRIVVNKLENGWWWMGLDCALATPPFFAYGKIFPEMMRKLERVLREIPKEDKIVMGNHFPLFPQNRPKHDLKGAYELQALLKQFPQVKLYLHGHDHHPYIIDKRSEGLPLVFNAGSCARKKDGGFTIYDLSDETCHFERYSLKKKRKELEIYEWEIELEGSFDI